MDSFLHTSERQGVQKFVFFKDLTSCLVKLENHTSNSCCWHNIYVACLQHELKLSLSFNHNTRRNDIIGKLHEFGSQSVAVNALVEPSTFLIGWHFVVVSPVLGPLSPLRFTVFWYTDSLCHHMCLFLCTAWLASRLLLKNPLFISVSSALAVVLAGEIVRIVD